MPKTGKTSLTKGMGFDIMSSEELKNDSDTRVEGKGGEKMRKSVKGIAALSAAALLALGMSVTAFAKDDIEDVSGRLEIRFDGEEPEAGDNMDIPGYTVTNWPTGVINQVSDEYFDDEEDEFTRGTKPVICLEFEAESGYDFDKYSKSSVKVSGMHTKLKKIKKDDDDTTLIVYIEMREISGDLEEPDEVEWSDKTATWSQVDDANKYEVKLYRNDGLVQTVSTTNDYYDFYSYMTKTGDYYFKVRAICTSDDEKSEWVESDNIDIDSSEVYTISGGSGAGWIQDANGWWYRNADGSSVVNAWLFVDNNWFHFNRNGYMQTDWQFIDNRWFYLNPVSDGTRGAMKTGWQQINGVWYYLNPVSDGTRGAMMTGYQTIDGKTYYFDDSGAMWANRTAPNGRYLDASGAMQ